MNAFDYFFENTHNLEKDIVLGPRETISYKELFINSSALSEYLQARFGKGQNIFLLATNSVFFITAYLAILKSGNVVVPLNPETEQSNLDYISKLCQPQLFIISLQLASKFQIDKSILFSEENFKAIIKTNNSENIGMSDTLPDQLAEIIFTSGSTGIPKGVMITHKNLIANTSSIVQYLGLTEHDTMLVVLPFYYCYGLSLLHTHLRVGGSIVLNNMFMMLGGVINDLKRYRCTGFAGVPSHFQVLLRKSDSFRTTSFPDLKYVTQAGGKLHNVFIQEFLDTFPDKKFIVMYGQTEATARLSWLPPEKLPEKIGSCGKGIPGVKLIVADENGNQIKPGETGEILAYGDNIMQGYFKDPESTKLTIKNGWLHTGDLATIDEDGYIFLTARKKEIIKVGGRRISPKEIEEAIVSIPDVIDCSIEAVSDDILGEAMKATVVIKESAGIIKPDEIKKHLSKNLAAYKIPQIIEIKERIAVAANGKKVKNIQD
ncbi:MAG: AMP-binding protein [Bacteroidales bacterium]|nr:AMP-binding protein [Bacteroidales bacterium]